MLIPSPLYPRTSALSETQEWRDWAGYLAAGSYHHSTEFEYYALRTAAGLIDVSPLQKYEVVGPEAAKLLDRVMTRDIAGAEVGQVLYTPWCDEDGKVLDDGTVARLAEDRFRVTSADPNLRWFQDVGYGLDAEVVDRSEEIAALALQGPLSRDILKQIVERANLDELAFFREVEAEIEGIRVSITRTGYTGDLGYELWTAAGDGEQLWDAIMEAGSGYRIAPVGLAALDISRIEGGLLLIDVDYVPARKALIEAQKSSPYEIGLGWAVNLAKPDFIGRSALMAEKETGSKWKLAGLEVGWESLEELFGAVDLGVQVTGRAVRSKIPVYSRFRQVGQATSLTFSPITKRYIALATVLADQATIGTELELEITVEDKRRKAPATVVRRPFFDPPRKRAT